MRDKGGLVWGTKKLSLSLYGTCYSIEVNGLPRHQNFLKIRCELFFVLCFAMRCGAQTELHHNAVTHVIYYTPHNAQLFYFPYRILLKQEGRGGGRSISNSNSGNFFLLGSS